MSAAHQATVLRPVKFLFMLPRMIPVMLNPSGSFSQRESRFTVGAFFGSTAVNTPTGRCHAERVSSAVRYVSTVSCSASSRRWTSLLMCSLTSGWASRAASLFSSCSIFVSLFSIRISEVVRT